MWWLKLNKKFFWALLQCIHVNFFIFFESVNLTHSVESTESKVLEITNLMLKTYIIAMMQFWSLLIIIISLNFAYSYAIKISTMLARPNLTLIAEKFSKVWSNWRRYFKNIQGLIRDLIYSVQREHGFDRQ